MYKLWSMRAWYCKEIKNSPLQSSCKYVYISRHQRTVAPQVSQSICQTSHPEMIMPLGNWTQNHLKWRAQPHKVYWMNKWGTEEMAFQAKLKIQRKLSFGKEPSRLRDNKAKPNQRGHAFGDRIFVVRIALEFFGIKYEAIFTINPMTS